MMGYNVLKYAQRYIGDEYPTLRVWKYGRFVAIRDINRKVMPDEFVDVMFFIC